MSEQASFSGNGEVWSLSGDAVVVPSRWSRASGFCFSMVEGAAGRFEAEVLAAQPPWGSLRLAAEVAGELEGFVASLVVNSRSMDLRWLSRGFGFEGSSEPSTLSGGRD